MSFLAAVSAVPCRARPCRAVPCAPFLLALGGLSLRFGSPAPCAAMKSRFLAGVFQALSLASFQSC